MNPFSLLIKPASAHCNLQCAYCFYSDVSDVFPTGIGMMSPETVEKLIQSYQALPFEGGAYAYAWQGGEPMLMGLDFYRHVVTLQQKYASPFSTVTNALQTNATLMTEEWAAFLAEHHFLSGVSLDGPEHFHDRFRLDKNGRGTHASVMRAIALLKAAKAEFNILTLITPANAGAPGDVFDYLTAEGFNWLQFIPCVEIAPNGSNQPYGLDGDAWGDFLCGLFDAWYPHRYEISVRFFDGILAKLAFEQVILCHFGRDCRQYLLVEFNGDVFPCDFFVRSETRLGNVKTHPWTALRTSRTYEAFGLQKESLPGKCKHCKHAFLCAGDCLKHRIVPPGNSPGQLSRLCTGYKKFYDYALPRFRNLAEEVRQRHIQGGNGS